MILSEVVVNKPNEKTESKRGKKELEEHELHLRSEINYNICITTSFPSSGVGRLTISTLK